MKSVLYLGTKNYSSWSLRPWLVAKKAGFDFEEVVIDFDQPDTKQKIQAVSPSGKVPVWVDEHVRIWDSLAICEYFAEQVPSLWPSDPIQRAQARAVSAEMHSGFPALRSEMGMNVRAYLRGIELSEAAKNDLKRIEVIWTALLEAQSNNPNAEGWLFGRFSIADAMFAPVAIRLNGYAVPMSASMKAYQAQFYADPDFQQWIKDAEEDTLIVPRLEIGQDNEEYNAIQPNDKA
ncbi:glutathione S-transferase family protein [Acinetobacter shaoyimingii]|uniref:Glutathione S-transferase family protein n=1 Tax=Acinetobacter shaoyimingii TaxID=2715164 RepID=A0A6G8RT57_9GAMM|nr:glutathione S-transferase family protein [Acinetobacter shaoyimingii]QIO04903.1 glutathione S-transferase family protein [Acinetobacter shaoyimingii]